MMTLHNLIQDIRNTKDIENIDRILPTLGPKIKELLSMAEKADAELDIVHLCLTEIYSDETKARIKKCLDDIKLIK